MKSLNAEQQNWVDKTFSSLSLEQRVAQLLIPKVDAGSPVEVLTEYLQGKIEFGGLFVWGEKAEVHRERIGRLQKASRIPLVVAADLENGAGQTVFGTTQFPSMLALGAAGDEQLAYEMGKASAIDGWSAGIHWTFAPVVDVNVNPDNPIANHRCLGDDPDRISRLAKANIRGMQEHGLAACAKHFPGDGIDDVDQHIATSANSLSMERWKAISGRTFSAAFSAEVWSVMIGHIALPAWDSERDKRGAYRPATLSRRITTDLLRNEMQFKGLAVTDDMNMGGASGYANRKDRTVGCITAGCDMLLFPFLPQDYETLLQAVRAGTLSEERVNEAARRVLEFKARLNLHHERIRRDATADERASFDRSAREIAGQSIVLVRNTDGLLPLRTLKPGARVLTVTLTNDRLDLPEIDQELAARGFKVEHVVPTSYGDVDPWVSKVDAIFVNFTFSANWGMGSPRSVGPHNRSFMNGFYMEHPCVVFTSFGSPYHLRQFNTLPNYINVHSFAPASQRAAVAAWFGEAPMTAKSPVGNLERKF